MPIFTGAALAGTLGAAGAIGSSAINAASAGSARSSAKQAGEFGQYSKFREELGATNQAFKNAIKDTEASAFDPYSAQQNQVRAGQLQLAGLLAQRAQGQGPSQVDPLVAQARQDALSQQLALQNSSRGVNAGLAQRQAGLNLASANRGIVQSGMQSRIQEILGSQEQLGGLLGQVRGGDVTAGQVASQDSLARQAQRAALFEQALGRERSAASAATGSLAAQEAASARQGQAVGAGISGVASGVASALGSSGAASGPASTGFGSFAPVQAPAFGGNVGVPNKFATYLSRR